MLLPNFYFAPPPPPPNCLFLWTPPPEHLLSPTQPSSFLSASLPPPPPPPPHSSSFCSPQTTLPPPTPSPYLFLLQVLGVKLQVVELHREAAGVADDHVLLIPTAVREDGAKLHQLALKVQARLQPLAATQQQNPLAALGDFDGYALLVEFLGENKTKSGFRCVRSQWVVHVKKWTIRTAYQGCNYILPYFFFLLVLMFLWLNSPKFKSPQEWRENFFFLGSVLTL